MKERPILFSGPMVRALLAGQKTQTRRIVEPDQFIGYPPSEIRFACDEYFTTTGGISFELKCPFGKSGDRLWVRETWAFIDAMDSDGKEFRDNRLRFRADAEVFDRPDPRDETSLWRPSIHMPRWASRITLEITGVRVERLQEISDEDAKAEGCEPFTLSQAEIDDLQISDEAPDLKLFWKEMGPGSTTCNWEFQMLWSTIHSATGPQGWAANPWVWVVEFRSLNGGN